MSRFDFRIWPHSDLLRYPLLGPKLEGRSARYWADKPVLDGKWKPPVVARVP
jgi:hypothetical protein